MKKEFLLVSFVIVLMALISCKKDTGINWKEIDPSDQSELSIKKDSTPFSSKQVMWLITEDSSVANDMLSRIQGTASDIEDAKLIFADKQALKTNGTTIYEGYQRGAIIIVVNPNCEDLKTFMVDYNIVQVVPSSDRSVSLYAFAKKGAYTVYTITDPKEYQPSLIEKVPGTEQEYEYTEEDSRDTEPLPTDGLEFTEIGWYVKTFINWVNRTSESNEPELEGVATYNCQYTYNLDLFVHQCLWSGADRIKGPYTIFANYSYKPVYIYPDQSYSPGDFYSFNATYGCETGQIFYGDDFVNGHGGVRVHICGAFLRHLDVRTYIDGDESTPTFLASYEPIPTSDIDTKNYSETKGWNIGGGVTSNFGFQNGKPLDTKSASFNWGYSNSSTVSYSVSDLAVENDFQSNYSGHGASPAWSFICQNLPGPSGDISFGGTKTPIIAKSTLSCAATWIWHTDSHSVNDTLAIGKLCTMFCPELGAAHNGRCVDGEKNYYELDTIIMGELFVVPFRIPFGTVRIINTFEDNSIMSDISVCRTSDGKEMYHSQGDFSQENPCEFSVAEGSYNVTMKVTDRNRTVKNYKMIDILEVTRRKTEQEVQQIDGYIRFKEE